MADLKRFQNQIDVSFTRLALLEEALTHSSYLNEAGGKGKHSNERLEFLGDAILGLVIAERLFQDLPNSSEGDLTKARSMLIRRETLAEVASAISLGDFLKLGKGEAASGGRQKAVNLAGAFEALVAAIYLDQGQKSARDFILRTLESQFDRLAGLQSKVDYKSQLQELIQSRMHVTPEYKVIEAIGPTHDPQFLIEVRAGEEILGRGSGKSKKAAETEAARSALARLDAAQMQR